MATITYNVDRKELERTLHIKPPKKKKRKKQEYMRITTTRNGKTTIEEWLLKPIKKKTKSAKPKNKK